MDHSPCSVTSTPLKVASPYYSPAIRRRYSAEIGSYPPFPVQSTKFADIGYIFEKDKYIERSEARIRAGGLTTELPPGWPEYLEGPLVWTGSEFPDESAYVYELTINEKEEIRKALAQFKSGGNPGKRVNKDRFPLPGLAAKLRQIQDEVYEGRGFAILRGLDVQEYPDELDLVTVYLGLTSHVAELRGMQNHRGGVLIHVVNNNDVVENENATTQMPFHTDLVCDVISTLTKSCSASGGAPVLASAWTVYNELAATRPDLIHVLAEPDWPFDTFQREPPYYRRALLHLNSNGQVIANFSRRALLGHDVTGGPRTSGVPGLSEAQAEALDALHFIGRRHELVTSMRPGDIRFVNNMGLMHRREAYSDIKTPRADGKSERQIRHLIRLWLHNPERCWPLPPALQLAWERVYGDGDRTEQWDLLVVDEEGKVWAKPIWQKEGDGGGQQENGTRPEPLLRPASPTTACD